jgi:hypothetical protein
MMVYYLCTMSVMFVYYDGLLLVHHVVHYLFTVMVYY